MDEKKKANITLQEAFVELDDELLDQVVGGIGITSVGETRLANISTGGKLPKDTGFGK